MIRLLRAAFTVRWRAALVIFLLSTAATAAAVAAPLYRWVAADAATTAEVTAAPALERLIIADRSWEALESPESPQQRQPPELLAALPVHPGFDTVAGLHTEVLLARAGVDLAGTNSDPAEVGALGTLTYRTGFCDRIVLVAGRCPSGRSEVALTESAARLLDADVGGRLGVQPGRLAGSAFAVDAGPGAMTVVGVYAPRDVADLYWATRPFFGVATEPSAPRVDAVLATRETLLTLSAGRWDESVDLIAQRAAFTDLAPLREVVFTETARLDEENFAVRSDIGALADRIATSRWQLGRSLVVAGVPLVLLSWFVLYFAIANAVQLRRGEAGLMALRGVPGGVRWVVSAAEPVVAVLAGAPAGYLLGFFAVGLLSRTTLVGAPEVTATANATRYAVAAVGGAVLIGLLAQWRAATAPVAVLLRQDVVRRRELALSATEIVVAVLAAAAAYQITAVGGAGGGLAPLVPVLIALTAGLLGARLAGALAARVGRRALRRGRLVRGLAAVEFARQPGHVRLLALSVVVFGLVGFAVAAVDVAAAANLERSRVELGAPRVLGVQPIAESRLVQAVRSADPEGRYAMAVAGVTSGPLTALAVDTTRLAQVAYWDPRYGPATAAEAAALLRPEPPQSIPLRGSEVTVTVTVRAIDTGARTRLSVIPQDGPPIWVPGEVLRRGTRTYRFPTPGCAAGCRFGLLEFALPIAPAYRIDATVREVRASGTAVPLGGPQRWRLPGDDPTGPTIVADGAGLRVAYDGRVRPELRLMPVQTPVPLPVLAASQPPATVTAGGVGLPTPVRRAAQFVVGPGARPALIDIEYADLAVPNWEPARDAQVWLAAGTPPSVVDALRAAGLHVLSDTRVDDRMELFGLQGPALALRFYLVAAFVAVGLGIGAFAVAGADRTARVRQLRNLRAQGVPAGVVWRSELAGHIAVIGAAAVLGLAAAVVAWRLARTAVPLFADDWALAPPPWPAPAALLGPVVAAAVLAAVGAGLALSLRRMVERSGS